MDAPIKGSLAQRSAWWAMEFTKLLAESPDLRASIPSGAKICVLPAEDPELSGYNASLALRHKGDIVVFVSLERQGGGYTRGRSCTGG
jgi:hypothetical protein